MYFKTTYVNEVIYLKHETFSENQSDNRIKSMLIFDSFKRLTDKWESSGLDTKEKWVE